MSGLPFLALLMVVVSGLIAYIGDLIGRKMGRKRLTLFGLRPRYTAIVISVAAGMVIALCTLAAAFIVSKPVRDAIFIPREKLQKQNDDLQKQNDDLKKQVAKERDDLRSADQQLTKANQDLTDAQQRVAGFSKDLALHEKLIAEKKKQLERVGGDLKKKNIELRATQTNVFAQGKIRLELEKTITRLEFQQKDLQKQINALDPFLQSNFSPLAFASGQEILSGLVPTKGSPDARRVRLRGFLDTAERIVRQQCGLKPTVENPCIFLQVDNNGKITKQMNEDEAVERLSNRLAGVSGARDAVVRLVPANNVPVGGQAFIDINAVQIVPNTQVFNAGDEVARLEMTITSQTTSGDILTLLVDDLLRAKVPAALREQQMPLILRRFNPSNPTKLPGASPSLLSWDDLATAMEKARKMNGKVSIIAHSSKAVNRFDPLDLTLEVVGSD